MKMRAIGNQRNTPEPKESQYLGYLLIPVGYGQQKKFIVATLDRKYVSGLGEYGSKSEAKAVIRNFKKG